MIFYDGEILVTQTGILNGVQNHAKGRFFLEEGSYFVELLDDSPFLDFHSTQSRFNGTIEIEEKDIYEIFELSMLPNPNMTEFEVIEDNEFNLMKSFMTARKLENELKTHNKKKTLGGKI